MNVGKLDVVKQEIATVNIDILWISELKWAGMGDFNSMTIIPTSMGKNPLEEMKSPSVNKRVQNAVSSFTQSCPTLCNPMNHSTSGLSVYHQLPEFTQTHVHRVGDAIQPSSSVVPFSSCPQSLPGSKSFLMSQLFAWRDKSIGVSASASVLPMNT